jgi:hypothetical protein
MPVKLALAGLVMAMLLAGCTSGGGSSSAASGPSSGKYATAQAVIEDMKTKGLQCLSTSDRSGQLYTKDGWECDTTADGGAVTAYLFSDSSNRDSWLQVAKGFGGNYVVGDKWVVATDTPALANQVRGYLGGTVK